MSWVLLRNSLLVAGGVALLSSALGFVVALWLAALEAKWRRPLFLLTLIAFMMPPFLVTNCWLNLFGLTGVLKAWVPWNIYSLGGTIWVLTLLLWPVAVLFMLGAWRRLEPAQLETDPALTGGALIRWLLWPMARRALGLAAVITFVLALNNFAVPAILQVKVYPAELWVRYNTHLNAGEAFAACWPLLVGPLVLLWGLRQAENPWPRETEGASARVLRRQLGGRWMWAGGVITVTAFALSAGLPCFQLLGQERTWTELPKVWPVIPGVAWNSWWFAAAGASLALVLGMLTAPSRWGWWLWLLFLAPGVFLGMAVIIGLNRPGLDWLYRSPAVVVLAWALRYSAVAWHALAHARSGVDRDLADAVRLEGASRWGMLRYVWWPHLAPQAAGAWLLVYLLCLWDVETLVLIYPPGGETLALRIFNLLHYGHTAQVNTLCVLLLALAVLPLLVAGLAMPLWRRLPSLPYRGFGNLRNVEARVPSRLGSRRYGRLGNLRYQEHASPQCWSFPNWTTRLWPLALAVILLAGCAPQDVNVAPINSRLFSSVQILGTRGTALGQFNKPRSVAVDAQDCLYVVDMTGRVQKFSPAGEPLLAWQMPQTDLGKPKGMCLDARSNLVVLEPHYSRVNHFNTEGRLVEQWGVHGTNAGQLAFPRAVAANAQGEIFVSEYGLTERVQWFTGLDKSPQGVLGKPGDGPGEFNRPEGLALDAAGRLYVADSCNHRIQVFSREGRWLRAYGRPGRGPGELSYPYDVRIDAQGRQFVCEFGNSRVQIFDANDRLLEVLGGPGGAPGQFNNPWSIALDSHGNLYVADAGNHRVQKFARREITHHSSTPNSRYEALTFLQPSAK